MTVGRRGCTRRQRPASGRRGHGQPDTDRPTAGFGDACGAGIATVIHAQRHLDVQVHPVTELNWPAATCGP